MLARDSESRDSQSHSLRDYREERNTGSAPVPHSRSELRPRTPVFFLGDSHAAQELWEDVCAFAATPYPVLLLGPTGSGKSVLARAIHAHSSRAAGPFVEFPLTSVPEDLRHAQLSGSSRGSYTGATRDRPGAVESAHRGTLFLDELNHATLRVQQALLTLLEAGGVQRVGEVQFRPVDVRFVLASSADLEELARLGRFLEELRYRIDCLTIRVPELSARRADILPMAGHFVDEALTELNRPFLYDFAAELREFLEVFPWPGNIRQLRSICRFLAVQLHGDRTLLRTDLPRAVRSAEATPRASSLDEIVRAELKRTGGNKARAARQLGFSRTKLYRLLEDIRPSP